MNTCKYCNRGVLNITVQAITEHVFYKCDFCGTKYCKECWGTLNVRGHTSKYKYSCVCNDREEKVEDWVLLSEQLDAENSDD